MIKKQKINKDNVVKFPSKLTEIEKEIEGVIFAAAEPLDIDTIESKLSKKLNVSKSLEKLQQEYSNRGINLVCIKFDLSVISDVAFLSSYFVPPIFSYNIFNPIIT